MARYHFNWNLEATQSCSKSDCTWGFHSEDEMETARMASAKSETFWAGKGFTELPPGKSKRKNAAKAPVSGLF